MRAPEWFRPFARRIRLMTARAVVRLIDDAMAMQLLQVDLLAGETRDQVERWQQYGFTAHPHPGAEAIALSVGGQRAHTVVIAVDDRRYRLTGLAEGEVAIYDDLGNLVHLMRDRLKVTAAQHLELTAPTCDINAEVTINGNVTVSGDVVASGISLTQHTHPGDSGGTTGLPQ